MSRLHLLDPELIYSDPNAFCKPRKTEPIGDADLTDSSATSQEPELVLNHLLPVQYCLDPHTVLFPINRTKIRIYSDL